MRVKFEGSLKSIPISLLHITVEANASHCASTTSYIKLIINNGSFNETEKTTQKDR